MRENAIEHDSRASINVLEDRAKRFNEAVKLRKALKESQKEVEKVKNAHLELQKAYSSEIEV